MSNDALIIGGLVVAGLVIATKGKIVDDVSDSLGQGIANLPMGLVKGGYKAGKNYINYFNEEGKSNPLHLSNLSWSMWSAGQKFKKFGSDDKWLW